MADLYQEIGDRLSPGIPAEERRKLAKRRFWLLAYGGRVEEHVKGVIRDVVDARKCAQNKGLQK